MSENTLEIYQEEDVTKIINKSLEMKDGNLTEKGWSDISKTLQAYSDKRFETARYLFVQHRKIIRHVAISVQNPNATISKPDENVTYLEKLKTFAQNTNSSVVFVHNHPSGYVEPSLADKDTTQYLHNFFGDLFAGHIILDHGKFGIYEPKNQKWQALIDNKIYEMEEGKTHFSIHGSQIGIKQITNEKDLSILANYAKKIDNQAKWNRDDWIPAFYSTHQGIVQSLEYLHNDDLKVENYQGLTNQIKYVGRDVGCNYIYLVPKTLEQKMLCEAFAQKTRIVQDIYFEKEDGTYELSNYSGGDIFSSITKEEIKMDDSINYKIINEEDKDIMEKKEQNPWFEKLSDIEKEAVLSDMRINPDLIGEYHSELAEANIDYKEYDRPPHEWFLDKINYKNLNGEFSYFNENNIGQQRHYAEVINKYKQELAAKQEILTPTEYLTQKINASGINIHLSKEEIKAILDAGKNVQKMALQNVNFEEMTFYDFERNFEPKYKDYEMDCSGMGILSVSNFIEEIEKRNNDTILTVNCSDGSAYHTYFDKKRWEDLRESVNSRGEAITKVWVTEEFNKTKNEKAFYEKREEYWENKYKNENVQYMKSENGEVYGFTFDGEIYIDEDLVNSNVLAHEYTHIWDNYVQKNNPELWQKGMTCLKGTSLWYEITEDKNYENLRTDDEILSECHARIVGKMAEQILEQIAARDGELTKDKIIDWDREISEYVATELLIKPELGDENYISESVKAEYLKEFLSMPMKDLMNELKVQMEKEKKVENEAIHLKSNIVEDMSEDIKDIYSKKEQFIKLNLSPASDWLIKKEKEVGIDISGYMHQITTDFMKHTLNNHGDEKSEEQRGNIAITEDDFTNIQSVFEKPDLVVFGLRRKNEDMIIYTKKLEDGTTVYMEEILSSKKNQALRSKTMYKSKNEISIEKLEKILRENKQNDCSKMIITLGEAAISSVSYSEPNSVGSQIQHPTGDIISLHQNNDIVNKNDSKIQKYVETIDNSQTENPEESVEKSSKELNESINNDIPVMPNVSDLQHSESNEVQILKKEVDELKAALKQFQSQFEHQKKENNTLRQENELLKGKINNINATQSIKETGEESICREETKDTGTEINFNRNTAFNINCPIPPFGHEKEDGSIEIIENAHFAKHLLNKYDSASNKVVLTYADETGKHHEIEMHEREYRKMINACEEFAEKFNGVAENSYEWYLLHEKKAKIMKTDQNVLRLNFASNFIHNYRIMCKLYASNEGEAVKQAQKLVDMMHPNERRTFNKWRKQVGEKSFDNLLLKEFRDHVQGIENKDSLILNNNELLFDVNKRYLEFQKDEEIVLTKNDKVIKNSGKKIGDTIKMAFKYESFGGKKLKTPMLEYQILKVTKNQSPDTVLLYNAEQKITQTIPLKDFIKHVRKIEKQQLKENAEQIKKDYKIYGYEGR